MKAGEVLDEEMEATNSAGYIVKTKLNYNFNSTRGWEQLFSQTVFIAQLSSF